MLDAIEITIYPIIFVVTLDILFFLIIKVQYPKASLDKVISPKLLVIILELNSNNKILSHLKNL